MTIPNGIDAEQYPFRRSNGAGDGQPWRLVFAGQLIPFKRCDLAISAIARLNLDIELTLAYQNPALESELRALAVSLGIADRIKFAGKHNPAQLADLYHRSDLLVLPSDNEALPSVITEAMLTGLPFVTTTVGGIPEQSGSFGSLLTRPTVEMLAGNIAHVLKNYATYSASSQKMSDDQVTKSEDYCGVEIRSIKCTRQGLFRAAEFMFKSLRDARALRPDVLHFHALPEGAAFATRFARGVSAKTVLSFDYFIFHRGKQNPLFSWYQRALTSFSSLLPVSDFCRREAATYWSIPEARMRVLYNGVSLQQFSPRPEPTSSPPSLTTLPASIEPLNSA